MYGYIEIFGSRGANAVNAVNALSGVRVVLWCAHLGQMVYR